MTDEIRLDIGCGPNKREGHIGVDKFPMTGVDVLLDLEDWVKPWPWEDGSVTSVHCSHTLEHLTSGNSGGRVRFFNELFRVLKVGGTAQIITPSWSHNRAYGDFDHKWPAVSEMMYWYLDRKWRKANAPHDDAEVRADGYGLNCHFLWQIVNSFDPNDPWLIGRNPETLNVMLGRNINSAVDLIANLTKVEEQA